MGDRVPWQPAGGPYGLIVDRFDVRPWPVNPRQYPLQGRTRGPMYIPPAGEADGFKAVMVACAIVVMGWAAVLAIVALGVL